MSNPVQLKSKNVAMHWFRSCNLYHRQTQYRHNKQSSSPYLACWICTLKNNPLFPLFWYMNGDIESMASFGLWWHLSRSHKFSLFFLFLTFFIQQNPIKKQRFFIIADIVLKPLIIAHEIIAYKKDAYNANYWPETITKHFTTMLTRDVKHILQF